MFLPLTYFRIILFLVRKTSFVTCTRAEQACSESDIGFGAGWVTSARDRHLGGNGWLYSDDGAYVFMVW